MNYELWTMNYELRTNHHAMHEVTPSVVPSAVRILISIWITIFQVSFFIIKATPLGGMRGVAIKMELILERTELREDCTVGRLSVIKCVDDEYLAGETKDFLYDTLEPRVKELDAKGRYTITTPTAIPEGRYAVVITYCKEQDRWLPLLLWVPRFKDVRIRVGKTVKDIPAGGILIGLYRPDGRIINGPNSVYGLKEMIVQAKKRNEAVYLTVKRSS